MLVQGELHILSDRHANRLVAATCALLIAAVVIAYWPVRHSEFLICDDPSYVTANPHVSNGISGENVAWAFTTIHSANWHPLTWLSHMLDSQLYDLQPRGHHITNVLPHAASTLLLFGVMLRMTRRIWPSAFVAGIFGLHPLHVESVAWVAERKDVLSAFFFMLTL